MAGPAPYPNPRYSGYSRPGPGQVPANEVPLAEDGLADGQEGQPLLIDCDSCQVRPQACGDCVVSVLLGPPDHEWEPEEQRALEVLAESGLVPHLRLVPGPSAGGLSRGAGRPPH